MMGNFDLQLGLGVVDPLQPKYHLSCLVEIKSRNPLRGAELFVIMWLHNGREAFFRYHSGTKTAIFRQNTLLKI